MALFAEMYGFPLTIYFLASYVGWLPATHWSGHLLGPYGIFIGTPLIAIGAILVISAWKKIHLAGDKLATEGVYRHIDILNTWAFC